uniref:Uncharacterized protein n=1 Tax=Arundo donax TaxID=35708 RepID=A0A0A9FL30_ARUDO
MFIQILKQNERLQRCLPEKVPLEFSLSAAFSRPGPALSRPCSVRCSWAQAASRASRPKSFRFVNATFLSMTRFQAFPLRPYRTANLIGSRKR